MSEQTALDRAKYTLDFLMNKGYSKLHASAIVGNLWYESGSLNPSSVNQIGATGLAQWLGARKTALMRYARSVGKPVTDFDTQLEFLAMELEKPGLGWLSNKDRQGFLETTNLTDATTYFRKKFERPGEHEANDIGRIAKASKTFNIAGGGNTSFEEMKSAAMDTLENVNEKADTIGSVATQIGSILSNPSLVVGYGISVILIIVGIWYLITRGFDQLPSIVGVSS